MAKSRRAPAKGPPSSGETSMKLVLTLLGVVLLVVAAVYFLVPADQLPGFFPGHGGGRDPPARQAWCGRRCRRAGAAGGRHLDRPPMSTATATAPRGGI